MPHLVWISCSHFLFWSHILNKENLFPAQFLIAVITSDHIVWKKVSRSHSCSFTSPCWISSSHHVLTFHFLVSRRTTWTLAHRVEWKPDHFSLQQFFHRPPQGRAAVTKAGMMGQPAAGLIILSSDTAKGSVFFFLFIGAQSHPPHGACRFKASVLLRAHDVD